MVKSSHTLGESGNGIHEEREVDKRREDFVSWRGECVCVRSRGQRCGDIELSSYLVNESGPVALVLDLHITHDRFGSRSDPSFNGHLHYPNDIDRSLNEVICVTSIFTSSSGN